MKVTNDSLANSVNRVVNELTKPDNHTIYSCDGEIVSWNFYAENNIDLVNYSKVLYNLENLK